MLARIRQTQNGLPDAAQWEHLDRTEQLTTIIERVGYNGVTRQICIRFRRRQEAIAGQQVRA